MADNIARRNGIGKSSMTLDQNKAIRTLVLVCIVQVVISGFVGVVFGILLAAVGVASGAIQLN